MPHERNLEFTSIEHENFKFAYDNKFWSDVKENPEIRDAAIALVKKAEDEYDPENLTIGGVEAKWNKETEQWDTVKMGGVPMQTPEPLRFGRNAFMKPGEQLVDESTGMEVMMLGKTNRVIYGRYANRKDRCEYLKLKYGEENYFVKKSFISTNPGFLEFTNTKKAQEELQHLDYVKLVDCKLGFQTDTESWYVAKWEDLESGGYNSMANMEDLYFDDYGKSLTEGELGFSNKEEFKEAAAKKDEIFEILKKHNLHYDLRANLFYNPKIKKFILLDVSSLQEEKMLGEPFKN